MCDELSPSEGCFPTNLHSVFVSVQAKPQRVNIVRTLRLVQTRPKKKKGLLLVLVMKINNSGFFLPFARSFRNDQSEIFIRLQFSATYISW